MKLTDEERKYVVEHRIHRAKETLTEAKGNIEMEFWHTAVNRLYYACYYAASALLIRDEHIVKTHSGAIGLLGEHFISKGLIDKEQGAFYSQLFELRQKGDYNDWIDVDPEQVKSAVNPAEEFIATIEKLINQ